MTSTILCGSFFTSGKTSPRRSTTTFTIAKLESANTVPGDVAWRLYDTYGFPIDLTQLMTEEKGLKIDMAGYEESKKQAQLISQNKAGGVDDQINLDVHAITELQKQGVKPTDDSPKYNYKVTNSVKYEEYEFAPCTGTVIALRRAKTFVDQVSSGEEVGILLDRTNFYAEQGGQIYDEGFLVKVNDEATEIRVKNVQVRAGYVLHIGTVGEGTLRKGDKVHANVDTERRRLVMANHSATHALNYALRKVLGTEADQKGSLVAPDRLRFDFTNKGPMTGGQLKDTELFTNDMIQANKKIYAKESNLAIAKTIQGLRAMFEETYPDPVRVVSLGIPVENLEKDPLSTAALETSVEFCGGTHLHYTGHIGDFVIASEDAIAKGIRRIVALTGPEATKALRTARILEKQLSQLQATIETDKSGTNSKEYVKKIIELTEEISHALIPAWWKDNVRNTLKELKKSLDDKERAARAAVTTTVVQTAQSIIESKVGCQVLVEVLEAYNNTKALDLALKKIRAISPETSALLISVDHDVKKIFALSSVPKSAISKGLKANEWIQAIASLMQGKGGGKPESAQASGTNIACLKKIVSKANDFANQKLGIIDNKTANNTTRKTSETFRLLNTESSSKLVLYGNTGSTKCYLAQIIAQYSGKCLTIKQVKDNKICSSDIILETADVTLHNSNAIAFFLSNSQLRCEDDLFASSQVLQWMSYAQNHILPAVSGWIIPSLGVSVSKDMKANMKISKEDLLCTVRRLDDILRTRTYLIGERVTLADISVFTALLPLYEYVFDPHYRKQYTNLNRWFSTILNQPQVKCVIKNFAFCEEATCC